MEGLENHNQDSDVNKPIGNGPFSHEIKHEPMEPSEPQVHNLLPASSSSNVSPNAGIEFIAGESPYTCRFCKRTFSLKNTLKRHLLIFHMKGKQCDFTELLERSLRNVPHTGGIPQQCRHCPAVFHDPHSFAVHLRTHTGRTSYQCEHCRKVFRLKNTLTIHLRTHAGVKGASTPQYSLGEVFRDLSNLKL